MITATMLIAANSAKTLHLPEAVKSVDISEFAVSHAWFTQVILNYSGEFC
jgi:hypothetical protein